MTYTEPERAVAAAAGFQSERSTYAAPNSLYSAAAMQSVRGARRDILYVGRLIEGKRPELAVRAFDLLVKAGFDGSLHLVGDGPLKAEVDQLVHDLKLDDRVIRHAAVFEPTVLRALHAASLCTFCPGYVGLNATQSLGWGLPMAYASDARHAPEACALTRQNSVSFSGSDPSAAYTALSEIVDNAESWISRAPSISESARQSFSIEAMTDGMLTAICDQLQIERAGAGALQRPQYKRRC